jgi:hypothetical protein
MVIVYVSSEAALPPKRAVITAAAVAVGHTRQSMNDSASTCMDGESGTYAATSAKEMNVSNWKASSTKCHFSSRSSLKRILQKLTKSIAKINPGCR